ncbi:MAG: hypothetical protein GY816_15370 [Cytophagales bacterium]|nr:hypothetical protein [Cytophagales bacterium]
MKKAIDFTPVKDVTLTIVKNEDRSWQVFLLNRSDSKFDTVLITSKGYGQKNKEDQKTSLLRHAIPYLESGMHALVEPIDPSVFHLTNEYWVSYFINDQIFDKKFVFVPETITKKNLTFITELNAKGVLHD